MHVAIRPLDATSDVELEQYLALDRALDTAVYGGSEVQTLAELRAGLEDTAYAATRRWVAVAEQLEGGTVVVGRASLHLPLQDNLESASVGASVHPAHRGAGIGTALLEEALVPALRESGRSLVQAWAEIPAEGDPDDPSLPAQRLAARLGLSRATVGVCRVLPLPLDPALLDTLGAEADAAPGGYRIALWDDEIPEEHLVAYGRLLTQLELDDPDEDMEWDAPEFPPERVRLQERRLREAGTARILAVAIAPDGTVAGNSEVHVQSAPGTTVGWQENTLVMPDHRGHRLGLALKVATHRELGRRFPALGGLVTFNSHVNPWMIAINERLGYRVACRELGLQGRPDLG